MFFRETYSIQKTPSVYPSIYNVETWQTRLLNEPDLHRAYSLVALKLNTNSHCALNARIGEIWGVVKKGTQKRHSIWWSGKAS